MVEKKTLVLCVVTILCLGLWLNAAGRLGGLEDSFDSLSAKYAGLTSDYSELKGEKEDLETEYSGLKSDYDSLKEDYDGLHSILEEGEAISESAEWVSEDGRLKVTSELITSETWWATYIVRVNVTNVGDEPIDKVLIFLITYKDGKFAESYFYGEYHSHTVENLYIGETYSYNFTDLPDDMTSYKVLAVAG